MRHLCDSNLLVALITGSHPHHKASVRWLDGLQESDTALLCRFTQLSFFRLLTLEAVMGDDVQTNARAVSVLENLMDHPKFTLVVQEPEGLDSEWIRMAGLRSASPRVWMDAYLAAFAKGLSASFVTFDKGFERYKAFGLDLKLLH